MIFSSSIFLVYFLPLFLLAYFISPHKFKNAVILIGSILFYSWGGPQFIFVILITTTIDFYLVKMMYVANAAIKRKFLFILSVSINLGLLFYFKYCNFFIDNINILFQQFNIHEITWIKIILPIGISFYTFESITYVVDVYRRIHKPLDSFWQYQLYILFFPKLIAGPIIRYHEIADQIKDRSINDTIDNKLAGFFRFVIGLSKKVLIANAMGEMADGVFNSPIDSLSSVTAWTGMLAYTFQIYFDFSGYSDMAIGIALMLGFKLSENFDNPYTAGSITEFWRRWHITLGKWMKNYLYIPLGGNQTNTKARLFFNLWIVFLASGLWHGAAWTFIFWGVYHGSFLVLERLFLLEIYKRMGRIFPVLITFLLVAIGWIFFRANDIEYALAFVKKLFVFDWTIPIRFFSRKFFIIFSVSVFFSFFTLFKTGKQAQQKIYFGTPDLIWTGIYTCIYCTLFMICLSFITTADFNPFIYFRF